MRVSRLFVAIASCLVVLSPALAEARQKFIAALASAQEVPANPSLGTGTCIVSLNEALATVSTTCSYAGLGTALIAGHIHGTAGVGVNAPIIINLNPTTGATSGTITAPAAPITPTQIQALREHQLYINLHSTDFPGGEIRGQLKRATTVFDLDGDGRTDVTAFRGSTGTFWTQRSLTQGLTAHVFGQTGDFWLNFYPGEWDGDGIADYALIRWVGSGLVWLIHESSTGATRTVTWGNLNLGDTLAPADYDGDGILDIAVFRRTTGNWYILHTGGGVRVESFGVNLDYGSVGDYDGDGRADLTIVRSTPNQWTWWTRRSSDSQITVTPWGSPACDGIYFFAPIDVDGDGRQDVMIVRGCTGQRQFIVRRSSDGVPYSITWGLNADTPLLGDYDGDGKTDFVAKRDVAGQIVWFIYQSSNGQVRYVYWGVTGDQ